MQELADYNLPLTMDIKPEKLKMKKFKKLDKTDKPKKKKKLKVKSFLEFTTRVQALDLAKCENQMSSFMSKPIYPIYKQ